MNYKSAVLESFERENILITIRKEETIILDVLVLVLARIISDIYRFSELYMCIVFILFMMLQFLKGKYVVKRRIKNIKNTVLKNKDNYEIKVTFDIFEQLLKNKKEVEIAPIIFEYLDLLFSLGHFDIFKTVYLKNRNVMKSPLMKSKLRIFINKYEELPENVKKDNAEAISIMKKDLGSIYGILKFLTIPMMLWGIVISLLFSFNLNEEASEKKYVSQMAFQGFIIEDLHGFMENKDMKVAVIYGKSFDYEYPQIYYLASIDYHIENLIPKRRVNMEKMSYLGEDVVYTYSGDESTYIAILSKDSLKIIYDGEEIEDILKEKLKKAAYQKKPYIYRFMIKGAYNEKLLKLEKI